MFEEELRPLEQTVDSRAVATAHGLQQNIRAHALVAVCDASLLANLRGEVRRLLGQRQFKELVKRAVDSDPGATRIQFEFDAPVSDEYPLIDLIRHLCTVRGVRYVRLHSGVIARQGTEVH